MINFDIKNSWKEIIQPEFEKAYFQKIYSFLQQEKLVGKIIYPKENDIFNAFSLTPFNKIKVVILGQDPYHQPNQAHGLSFSVLQPTPPPPSLKNICKELNTDLGCTIPTHGNLTNWALQGVFLLNTSLTVEAGKPMSHSKIGWEIFTNNAIHLISEHHKNIVFILWGKFAQTKATLIDSAKHLIIQSAHPSPLSAYNGFCGSKPFSTANNYLIQNNILPINWQL